MAKDGDGENLKDLTKRVMSLINKAAESMGIDSELANKAAEKAKISSEEAIKLLPLALIRRSMEDAMQEHDVKKESAKDEIESYLSTQISVTEDERLEEEKHISRKIKDATERAVIAAKKNRRNRTRNKNNQRGCKRTHRKN